LIFGSFNRAKKIKPYKWIMSVFGLGDFISMPYSNNLDFPFFVLNRPCLSVLGAIFSSYPHPSFVLQEDTPAVKNEKQNMAAIKI
jgi:hypothetical protein